LTNVQLFTAITLNRNRYMH